MDHEHDGSGCYDCECMASPMNAVPCVCPSIYQWTGRTLVDNTPIVQTRLWHPRFEMGSLGEMTKVQDGRRIAFEVLLDKQWEALAEGFDFTLFAAPKPIHPRPDKKPIKAPSDESHIVRGEN